jgi:hypothetical protein
MGHYRFDLLKDGGSVAHSQFHACADDLAALDVAERLCGSNAVDVWDGERRVLRVKRDNAMATPSDSFPG